MTPEFVHLHNHSEYSLLDGASRVQALVERARELGQTSIAITDHGVLASGIEFYDAATAAGLNPIIGCEVYVAARSRLQKEGPVDRDPSHLVLLARDRVGYANLVRLVSAAHLEGFYYKPRIDRELLSQYAEGLIGLSGCIGGEVPQRLLAGDAAGARELALEYGRILGTDSFFLELQDHGMEEERRVREGLIQLARETGLPLVATNDSHYVDQDDAEAHDVLLCIQTASRLDDPRRMRFSGAHFYLTSAEEMAAKFSYCLEAVGNSAAIAARCSFQPPLDLRLLPRYEVPDGSEPGAYLRRTAAAGLRQRLGGADPPDAYQQRLDYELSVIEETGFTAYFLIVWDFTRAGREQGVKIGPGRGSAAGSVVAWALGITNVDPIAYGLIFERFLNPERVSMPDIDIDFDVVGRTRVIDYVTRKYGSDRVAQIVTYGTMAARAALRDVGRVLSVPLSDVDRLAKLVPVRPGMTLDQALQESRELRELYEVEGWARQVVDTARRLEGICRNAGTHAAGVVIAPGPLTDFVPLQRSVSNREAVITQFDMTGVQRIGLLKMDFLGLENLTILEETLDNIALTSGVRLDLDRLPLDDRPTYELLARGDTLGVFQMEQQGGRRIVMDMKPQNLDDMAVAVALNRPGVIEGGATDIYMKRRRGEEATTYMLPELEPVLSETHGVILYQDQVMQIANVVAGFSLGAADVLRAAMGKKDKSKMAAQRERFIDGATARGVAEATAGELFDFMAYFAGYGFNKAHAVAYGLISYQTAYFKANYPLEYMAALLNSKAGDFDRLKLAIQDAQARGIVVHPPDLNRSRVDFAVVAEERARRRRGGSAGQIIYGLQHIKNVGEGAARAIVAEREGEGPYRSLVDLCLRLRGRELNRRVLEALIRCGACDGLGSRELLLIELDQAIRRADQIARERDSGQIPLFEVEGGAAAETVAANDDGAPAVRPLQELSEEARRERLAWERDLLGIYLTEHPLQRAAAVLAKRTDAKLSDLSTLEGRLVQVGGSLRECRRVRNRRGDSMAFGQLEDLSGVCELVIFPSIFQQAEELLQPDAVLVVRGRVEVGARADTNGNGRRPLEGDELGDTAVDEPEETRIIAEAVFALDDRQLDDWRAPRVVHIRISDPTEERLADLAQLLRAHPGDSPVNLHLRDFEGDHELNLGPQFQVSATAELSLQLVAMFGDGAYREAVIRQSVKPRRRAAVSS